jgi:ribose 5-phosphate isomerase B
MPETIAVASDHAGYAMKQQVIVSLKKRGFQVQDFGPFDEESMDYPDTIYPCAEAVGRGEFERGVVLCGSGIGASMVANKAPGVRAALVILPEHAALSRQHNNANILALSGRHCSVEQNLESLETWLTTDYEGGRHQQRIDKITALEQR